MKIKTLALILCFTGLASTGHASTGADVVQGTLVDDGSPIDNEIGGLAIELTDDGVPTELSESDSLAVDVASADGSFGGGCKTLHGVASIYGLGHGRGDGSHQKLASGGYLNTGAYTAAMLHVPLGKTVEVTRGGSTIKVRVNDRGPYAHGRIIDLTPAAARGLGFSNAQGTAHVQVKVCN